MDCEKAKSLVEKLADGETTADEKALAETHLETCASCRAHYAFLMSIEKLDESRHLPEPSADYWESFSRRVLSRIVEEEGKSPSGSVRSPHPALLTGTALRFVGLAAGLLLAVAVLWNVIPLKTHTSVPAGSNGRTSGLPSASVATPLAEQEEAPEKNAPARRAAASPPAEVQPSSEEGRRERADELTAQPAGEPPRPTLSKSMKDARAPATSSEEGVVSAPATSDVSAARLANAEAQEARAVGEAAPALGAAARPAPSLSATAAKENCEDFRKALQDAGEGREAIDLHYQLARCQLARYQSERSDEMRRRAIEDAEAFLALEPEGSRAEEIRRALSRVKE